jgi:hypothetical protein
MKKVFLFIRIIAIICFVPLALELLGYIMLSDFFQAAIPITCAIGLITAIVEAAIFYRPEDTTTFRITEGRIQAPDSVEWRDLTDQELKLMNENLKVTK